MADDVSLKEHFESLLREFKESVEKQFSAYQKAVDAALAAAEKAVLNASAAAEKAVLKAENASEKRFEGVNEFRAALSDQSKNLITRTEVEQMFKSLTEKVDAIASRMDRLEGRSGGLNQGWVYLVGAVSLIATIIGVGLVLK